MAGVDQHSDWRTDPGRQAPRPTSAYEVTVHVSGDRASATRAAPGGCGPSMSMVRGVDTVTGQPYAAGDPALLVWVHAALVDSGLGRERPVSARRRPAADADSYVAEMTIRGRTARGAARDDPG